MARETYNAQRSDYEHNGAKLKYKQGDTLIVTANSLHLDVGDKVVVARTQHSGWQFYYCRSAYGETGWLANGQCMSLSEMNKKTCGIN